MKPPLPAGLRRARKDDLSAMVDLLGELFAIETDFPVRPDRQAAGLAALLRDRRNSLIVAVEGGEVIGMATMQVLVSTAEGGPVGLVEDVVVCSHHRGRGIGKKLVAALESIARAQGLLRLQLLADERNGPAAFFYGGLGWTMTGMRAWRKLLRPC
jgi:GNAT superfamily N-acetyltransferase